MLTKITIIIAKIIGCMNRPTQTPLPCMFCGAPTAPHDECSDCFGRLCHVHAQRCDGEIFCRNCRPMWVAK